MLAPFGRPCVMFLVFLSRDMLSTPGFVATRQAVNPNDRSVLGNPRHEGLLTAAVGYIDLHTHFCVNMKPTIQVVNSCQRVPRDARSGEFFLSAVIQCCFCFPITAVNVLGRTPYVWSHLSSFQPIIHRGQTKKYIIWHNRECVHTLGT